MATTAFKTIAAQAALAVANSKGDMGRSLKQLASTQNIKHLAATVAAAGLINATADLPGNADLLDHAKTAATQTIVQKSTQVAIEGKSLKTALKEAPLEIAVDSLSGYGAQKLGDMKVGMLKAQGQNPSLGHKIGGELLEKVRTAIPTKDFAMPKKVASALAFLSSGKMRHSTGMTFDIVGTVDFH